MTSVTTRYVLYSEEVGVYLGSAMGLDFWSKTGPVRPSVARSFSSQDEARGFADSWETPPGFEFDVVAVRITNVTGDPEAPVYVTERECVEAGLPGWARPGLGLRSRVRPGTAGDWKPLAAQAAEAAVELRGKLGSDLYAREVDVMAATLIEVSLATGTPPRVFVANTLAAAVLSGNERMVRSLLATVHEAFMAICHS